MQEQEVAAPSCQAIGMSAGNNRFFLSYTERVKNGNKIKRPISSQSSNFCSLLSVLLCLYMRAVSYYIGYQP